MARYLPTVRTSHPEALEALGLQPGQWIDYAAGFAEPTRGRYYGKARGVVWIAWGVAARKRFPTFARVARAR